RPGPPPPTAETALLPVTAPGPATRAGTDTPTTGLTRRELRERARAEEATGAKRRNRGTRADTGETTVVPAVDVVDVAGPTLAHAPATDTLAAHATAPIATDDTRTAGRARGAGVVPGSWRSAGAARGAGVVPASPRSEQFRAMPATRQQGPAGAARGAGIVPGRPTNQPDRAGPPADTGRPAHTDRPESAARPEDEEPTNVPTWRSLWGFSDRPGEKEEER
ncbi:MAG: hypothetical protein ACYC1Z_08560, partial [Georgenia sp.]